MNVRDCIKRSMILSAVLCALVSSFVTAPVVAKVADSRTNAAYDFQTESTDKDPYWLRAKEIAYKNVSELIKQHNTELQHGIQHVKILSGNPQKKQVAITFDDGPHPQYTPQILSILRQFDVKATFFVVGMMAEDNPDLLKQEAADGHCIGNHTYHHVDMVKVPVGYMATEIKACGTVIERITHKAPHLFRPPGGDYNDKVAEVSEALGYSIVLWTNDPGDYASPGKDVIMTRLIRKLSHGGIILIHDGVQQTIDILPDLIKYLKRHGYEMVTIDELVNGKNGAKK